MDKGLQVDLATGPLSYAQRRFLLLNKLRPGDGAYNVYWGVRLRGALNVDAL